MAYHIIYFENPRTGQIREAPVGFSWTTLFFGPFPMLFRGNWKLFVIVLLLAILTLTLSDIVFAFIINKLHIKDLVNEGYAPRPGQANTLAKVLSTTNPYLISKLSKIPRERPETTDELCSIIDSGGSVGEFEKLFAGKSKTQIASIISSPDACENYPLHIAIEKKRLDLAEWLLQAGASPSAKNYWGKTPAEIAFKNNDGEAAALLQRYSEPTDKQ